MALTLQMLGSRRQSPGANNLPFVLNLDMAEIDKSLRLEDTSAVKKFNDEVRDWTKNATKALKSSVKSLIKNDVLLSDSIIGVVKVKQKEVKRVSFLFEREGVYVHYGAGRGQGGSVGSTWYNLKGEKKKTDPDSFGKMGKAPRTPIEWFDPVLDWEIPQLADIIADYSATLQMNASQIYIDKNR